MKVGIIGGSGYVGLVTGIGLAVHQHDVVCADIDEKKVNDLNRGVLPIYEKDLDALYHEAIKNHKIRFTTSVKDAVNASDILLIAVGTPENRNGDCDITYILRALNTIAACMEGYKVIAIKSTVPVGTCDMAERFIKDNLKNPNAAFDIVSNPEFLREGNAVHDFLYPERIVIGTNSEMAASIMCGLYSSFNAPIVTTDTKSSELIKYACNTYLATRISFINEIAEICECVGADVNAVVTGMKYDKRIGGSYLSPGPGFGGPCLSKDIKSLISFGTRANANVSLLKSVLFRNELQIRNIIGKVHSELGNAADIKVSVLGLSFKAGTDDVRNSPALTLIDMLSEMQKNISVYDPIVVSLPEAQNDRIDFSETLENCALGSDCLIIMTEWEEFVEMDLEALYSCMRTPLIIDSRNILSAEKARNAGFRYIGIGNCAVNAAASDSPADSQLLAI